jgi:ATP-dependent exoDNAse (exonuclease V) beta subunit
LSSRLIAQNPERLDKLLAADPERDDGPPVEAWRCSDADQEAAVIAEEAAAAHVAGVPLRRIAVLARTHAIARPIAAALARARVPFQHLAGQGLFQRPEVRDLVAYLRLLHDPTDFVALARLLERPPLGLDLMQALGRLRAVEAPRSPLRTLQGWGPTAGWATLMVELSALKAALGVEDLLFELLSRTQHLDLLLAGIDDVVESRRVVANVSRFGELVGQYCERRRDHSLSLFVEYLDLALRSGVDEDVAEIEDVADAVQLMTIHQAKGLEFDLVFVPALVEGRLPQPRRRDEISAVAGLELPAHLLEPAVRGREDQLAEERRLCYVAMTRARERLVLTWSERYEGERAWRRSRFLEELGPAVVERDLRREATSGVSTSDPTPGVPAEQTLRGDGSDEEVALSFSAISIYRECPRQHWYRYRLRLAAQPTDETQLGTIVPAALMRAGRLRRDGGAVTPEVLRGLHEEALNDIALVEPRRRPALKSLSWRLLERFFEAGGLDTAPRLVESPFTVAMDGWTLRGVIDRADAPREAGGPWRIVDYKTGSPLPASRLRRDLQLALYALGARNALGLQPAELEIVYLKDGNRAVMPAGDELLNEACTIAAGVAQGVRAGRFEPRPERRRCARCSYRLACEAAL